MPSDEFETHSKTYDQLVGATLGNRYEIVDVVSSGGAGDVYKVLHREMEKVYAAKVMRASRRPSQDSIKRFQREAQILCKLRHPNIVTVHSFGMDEKLGPYLIMDLLDGVPLSSKVKQDGALPLDEATKLLIQICDGMSSAHKIGILHRDIKPSNVMVVREGEEQKAVIIDFGAGKLLEGQEQQKLTQTDAIMGTPMYMAPEQCLSKPVDKRTDVYAMGCLMYEVLTGKPAFQGESTFDVLNKQINEMPAPPSVANPKAKIPLQIDQVVTQALQKTPDERLDTFSKIKEALEAAMQRPTYGKLAAATHSLSTERKRSAKQLIPLLAIVVALVGAATVAYFIYRENEAREQLRNVDITREFNVNAAIHERDRAKKERRIRDGVSLAESIANYYRERKDPVKLYDSLNVLAGLEFEQGQHQKALNRYNEIEAIKLPENAHRINYFAMAKLNKANKLMLLQRIDEALKELLALAPYVEKLNDYDDWSFNVQVGTCYLHKNELRRAEPYLQRAVDLADSDPSNHSLALVRLAQCRRRLGNPKEALGLALKARKVKPSREIEWEIQASTAALNAPQH
jgi:serine/threonine protein kinase